MKQVNNQKRFFTLGVIFFLSGIAALIYQVSWQRLLSLYYGVGSISTAIVVSIFMLGLGIGGLVGGRVSEKTSNPVLVYVAIESGIGIFGGLSLKLLGVFVSLTAGSDYSLMLLYVSLFLLIPTVLMGMTLPIVVDILQDISNDNLKNISAFYFINTLGAAFGALFCSYILITFFGIDYAISAAVLINLLLAITIFLVSKNHNDKSTPRIEKITESMPCSVKMHSVLILLFVNGFLAIGYQIIWFRIIGVALKDSAYAFSTILSIYLFGIGLGGYWLNKKGISFFSSTRFDFYLLLNALIAISSAGLFLTVYYGTDFWPVSDILKFVHSFQILPFIGDSGSSTRLIDFLSTLGAVVFWPLLLMLIPTFFMGAAFPIGISLVDNGQGRVGLSAGNAYAATILGNTLGGLISTFVLLPLYGTSNVLVGFAIIQVSYLFFLSPVFPVKRIILVSTGIVVSTLLIILTPSSMSFYQKLHPQYPDSRLYFKEGVEGVSLLFEDSSYVYNFINGSRHGRRPGTVYMNETIVALSYSKIPKNVLVIGLGVGSLLETILLDDRVENVFLVELNQTVLNNLYNIQPVRKILTDPRVHIIVDDGRRFLEREQINKFDLVTMDPLRSKSVYSNNIYSKEFFGLVKSRLANDGVFLVWTDDSTNRIAKGLAENYDFVNRYSYFMVASMTDLPFIESIYTHLVEKLPKSLAGEVKNFYGLPLFERSAILKATQGKDALTDFHPYLEYYLYP